MLTPSSPAAPIRSSSRTGRCWGVELDLDLHSRRRVESGLNELPKVGVPSLATEQRSVRLDPYPGHSDFRPNGLPKRVSQNCVSQVRAQLADSVAYLEARKRESDLMEFSVVERRDVVRLSPHGVLDLFCRSLRVWRRLSEKIRGNLFRLRRGQRETFIPDADEEHVLEPRGRAAVLADATPVVVRIDRECSRTALRAARFFADHRTGHPRRDG
jgi:hypothetical protein